VSENRQSRRFDKTPVEPDVDPAHEGWNIGFASGQPAQDRDLAILAMLNVVLHEAWRLAHHAAVARQVNRLRSACELLQ